MLERDLEAFTSLGKLVLLDLLLRLLTTAVLVDLGDVGSNATLELLELKRQVVVLVAEYLVGVAFLRANFDRARLLVLLHLAPGLLELLRVLSLGSDEALVGLALPLLKILLEPVKVDGVLNDHLLKGGLLVVLLPELALHIFEERGRADPDIGDLDSGEVDAPA